MPRSSAYYRQGQAEALAELRAQGHEHRWGSMTWNRGGSHVHACLVNGCTAVYVGQRRTCKSIVDPHSQEEMR